MAKSLTSKEAIQAKTGVHLIYSFATMLAVNTLVLMIANNFFPTHIVLGTNSISYWWAMHHSMVKLAMIGTFVMPLVAYYEWKRGKIFSPKEWMMTYMVVNTVALWGISRFATNLGLGISAWWVVLILAAVFNWAQGIAMMTLGKYLK